MHALPEVLRVQFPEHVRDPRTAQLAVHAGGTFSQRIAGASIFRVQAPHWFRCWRRRVSAEPSFHTRSGQCSWPVSSGPQSRAAG